MYRQEMGKAEQKCLARYFLPRLIRRYQLGARRMTIHSKPNVRVSLETKVMDDFCSVIHIVVKSTTVLQLGQRVCERMMIIGCSKLWKSWVRKWRLNPNSIENHFGYFSEKTICENIDAQLIFGTRRARQCMTS